MVLPHIRLHAHRTTHHCLHHAHPPSPHFVDKLKDVEVISLLQSLHHCIKSDESASATHTSTEGQDEHTDTRTEQTIIHIQYISLDRHLTVSINQAI